MASFLDAGFGISGSRVLVGAAGSIALYSSGFAVLDQDTDNFKRQWAGINASLKGKQTLANYQEARIRHFHQTLDSYLA